MLTEKIVKKAALELADKDADFKIILDDFGLPPLWKRTPGFETLLYIILEQQVSLASARAVYRKLKSSLGVILPDTFLKLDDSALRSLGFSRQKIVYGRTLSQSLISGKLNLAELSGMDEPQVRETLKKIKGIGDWTVDIYLMEALLHPDIWPHGDLALMNAYRRLKKLDYTLSNEEAIKVGIRYKPWRSVAARLLWHYYISTNDIKIELGLID